MRSVKVLIVGGSTVGRALAVMCQRNNIEAEVFEAAALPPSHVDSVAGVIGLEHTSLNALEQVGVAQGELVPGGPGDTEQVLNIVLSGEGSPVTRKLCPYPGRTTTYGNIQHALQARLHPGTYHAGYRVTDVTEDAVARKAIVVFSNGQIVHADIVVFADGRNSFGRQKFDPERRLHYAGYVAHRGLYPACPPDLAMEFVRMKTDGATFNTWPVQTEIDGHSDVGIDWTFYVNETPALYKKHYGREPEVAPYVMPKAVGAKGRAFVDAVAQQLLPPQEAKIVRATAMRAVAAVVDVPPPTRMVWAVNKSRVIIIGDALGTFHPITARGANAGIEQAADLTGVLRQHIHHGADLDAALKAMERRQVPPVACTLREGPLLGASVGLGRFGHSFQTLLGHAA